MGDQPPLHNPNYRSARLIVFFSTIVSSILACASLFVVSSVQVPGQFLPGFAGFAQMVTLATLIGGIVAIPVGLLSATWCAYFLQFVPARRAMLSSLLPSIVVGVLTAPIFHIFSALCVIITQLIASILVGGPQLERDSNDRSHCTKCRYSLVGLDRSKTTVCPECGTTLPVRSEAVEEEENR